MKLSSHNPKLIGERAECAFMLQALERRFGVSKPFGDSLPYDVIVDSTPLVREGLGRLSRVQVRCTRILRKPVVVAKRGWFQRGWFTVCAQRGCSKQPLLLRDCDFLAACVQPCATWYIIPVEAIAQISRIYLYPHINQSQGRFEKYREAWELLKKSSR